MAIELRNFSVYPVWITGSATHEYAKVRTDEGAIGVGRRVSVQQGETIWRRAKATEKPEDREGHGFLVWLELTGSGEGEAA